MARTIRNEVGDDRSASRRRSSEVSSLSGRRQGSGGKAADEPKGEAPETPERPEANDTGRSAGGDGRAVVTLSPAVAAATRRMGEQMGGAGTTEVVRRGLILLDLLLSLEDDEELVVRDTKTKQVERLRFAWDTF